MNLSTARKVASKDVVSLNDLSSHQQAKRIIQKARKRRKAHAKRTSGQR